jgi:flagellar biosynthesis/type III secretory pathway protein FliH
VRRVKRLKEAIARLERETGATEAQLEEEFEHGYAAGFNAASAKYEQWIARAFGQQPRELS